MQLLFLYWGHSFLQTNVLAGDSCIPFGGDVCLKKGIKCIKVLQNGTKWHNILYAGSLVGF